jgi:protocatechuate 3,4-dioxygenase beta subunit
MGKRYSFIHFSLKRQKLKTAFKWTLTSLVLLFLAESGNAQISGRVFRDYNSNGVRDSSATIFEPYASGITIKAYDDANLLVDTQTSAIDGSYSFTGLTLPLRIEFSGLPLNTFPSIGSNTSVQFYTSVSTTANFGFNKPKDYSEPNPTLITPKYINGATDSSGFDDVLYTWPYNNTGISTTGVTVRASKMQLGSVWGLAVSKKNKVVYSSTVVKRHVGVKDNDNDGFSDLGTVYKTDLLTNTSSVFVNIPDAGVLGNDSARGLGLHNIGNKDSMIHKVMKSGLGDIDISEDETTLYVTNLNDKKLYIIDIATSSIVNSYTIPNPCNASESQSRPFGLGVNNGEVYVGVVCDASVSGLKTNLSATIYKFSAGSFTSVLSFPLDYIKEVAAIQNPTRTGWYPWTDDYNIISIIYSGDRRVVYPMPVLSDIEFDVNGNMIMGFIDRAGFIGGYVNMSPQTMPTTLDEEFITINGGDILKANFNGVSFTLEPNPGTGEFFIDDSPGATEHDESSLGGLAINQSQNELVSTAMDPTDFHNSGTIFNNLSTGIQSPAFRLVPSYGNGTPQTFGKGTGLGDLELLSDPAPLEIGNRVWNDTNNNGIQDAGEVGISNVAISLYADFDNNGIPDIASASSNCDNPSFTKALSESCAATGVLWQNPLNAFVSNNVRTSANLSPSNPISACLSLSKLGLNIPSFAIIDSITLNIERSYSNNGAAIDHTIELITGGITSANKANAINWTTTDTVVTYSGDLNYWGMSLTPAMLNDTSFGVRIRGQRVSGSPSLRVDDVTIKICYSLPGTGFLGTTTTNASGEWFFNPANVPDGDFSVPGFQTGLQLYKNYLIRIGDTSWSNGTGTGSLSNLVLTSSNTGGAGQPDVRDNDALLIGGYPQISYTTGDAGENDHTLDFGFIAAPACTQPDAGADMTAIAGNCINLSAVNPLTGTWSAQAGNPSGATFGTTANGVAQVCFTSGFAGSFNFIYADGACQDTIQVNVLPKPACLGNYVFNDVNQDGVQTNGEVGVSGVTVSLLNGTSSAILATVTTDAYGFYQFCGLNPSSYKVQFSLPSNYIFSGQNAPNDSTDSDPNVFTGLTDAYVLASGDSNMTVDAGIYQPQPITATVGDRVWFDANNNGLQDVGESGVSGITISLFNCSNPGVPVMTTVSDAGGNYLFENVVPGSYQVSFSVPLGMLLTQQSGLVTDVINSDVNPSTERTACFVVNSGDNITYVDAGLMIKPVATSSIGDRVWNDANQDGIQDPNETGVQGVLVTLYQQDGTTVVSTTTTDGLGNYAFNGINPGCYVIGFSNLPLGYTFSMPNAGTDSSKNSDADIVSGKTNQVCITAGQNNPTIDAGIYNASNTNSIGDRVWYDANQNGLQDGPEYGYPGVVVTLYDCTTNTIVATTTTNSNGNYLFDGLANGDYYVGFGFIPGYQFTSANSDAAGVLGANNSDANPSSGLTACVTLSGNTNITTVDAGIYEGNGRTATSSLGDLVWVDANNNGLQDAGEPGVSGVTATLVDANTNTTLASTITDGLGNYIFTNLTGGLYRVEFSNIPAGYTFTTQSGSIEDELNSDANAGTGITSNIPLGLGEDKMSVDAGIVPPASTVCLGDYVWFDLNNNGVQDGNEPQVPGVTVKLYDNNTNTVLQVTTTNRQGKYLFCGLSNGNTYSVGFENLPAGYEFTVSNGALSVNDNSDANPTTGRTTTVTLGSTDDLTLDAGIYSTTTAVVGNYVWYDEDADGIQDATEAPIPGVLVTLYDNTNTPVSSAVTDANGGYLFTNVTPGNYVIGFSGYPGSLVPTSKGSNASADDDSNIDPNTGLTDVFTVTPGSSNLTLDAGYKANPVAGLGNYVWHDLNENGLQDPTEAPISGVVVTLYASDGTTPLGTAITDGNGAYSFPNLTAGSYIVGFSNLPNAYTRTRIIGVLNDALNSDINANNQTALITLSAGTYNPNIDAGFYMGVPLGARELVATLVKQQGANQAIVNWYTKDEENTATFEIQRSTNGSDYTQVGTKAAGGTTQGQTNYSAIDDISGLEKEAVIYYRIKLIDIDAQQKYSNTISLKLGTTTNGGVLVHPIPFTNRLTVTYVAEMDENITLELLDMSGRVIARSEKLVTKGLNNAVLENLESLSSSQYLLRIVPSGDGETQVIRVNK